MEPKGIFWCGEGDLNPHGIAPASTSSNKMLFRRVSPIDTMLILGRRASRAVSPILPRWLHFWLHSRGRCCGEVPGNTRSLTSTTVLSPSCASPSRNQ